MLPLLSLSLSLCLSLPSSGETAQVQRPGPEKERPCGGGVMSMQWSPFLPSGYCGHLETATGGRHAAPGGRSPLLTLLLCPESWQPHRRLFLVLGRLAISQSRAVQTTTSERFWLALNGDGAPPRQASDLPKDASNVVSLGSTCIILMSYLNLIDLFW